MNGAVRKGERLVPAGTFDLFMRGAFPVPNARVKVRCPPLLSMASLIRDNVLIGAFNSLGYREV